MKPYLYELDIVNDLIRVGMAMGRTFVDMNSVSVVLSCCSGDGAVSSGTVVCPDKEHVRPC